MKVRVHVIDSSPSIENKYDFITFEMDKEECEELLKEAGVKFQPRNYYIFLINNISTSYHLRRGRGIKVDKESIIKWFKLNKDSFENDDYFILKTDNLFQLS